MSTVPESQPDAGADVEALAKVLGDIRVAGAREADWWTSDEDHRLLIQVLRGECIPWAEGLLASDWLAALIAAAEARGAAEALNAAAELCLSEWRYSTPKGIAYLLRARTAPVTDRPTMSQAECRCPDDCDCDGRFACEASPNGPGIKGTWTCELVAGHEGWHRSGGHRWPPATDRTEATPGGGAHSLTDCWCGEVHRREDFL